MFLESILDWNLRVRIWNTRNLLRDGRWEMPNQQEIRKRTMKSKLGKDDRIEIMNNNVKAILISDAICKIYEWKMKSYPN